MTMPPWLRSAALTLHVATSVGLLGAVAVFLALALPGLGASDGSPLGIGYIAMDFIARVVVLPLAIAALVLGCVQSLGTAWGLLRHYWVIAKLAITAFATVVLLIQMPAIRAMAVAAADGTVVAPDLRPAQWSLTVHAGAGLAILVVALVLSIYKPRGMTGYGRRPAAA